MQVLRHLEERLGRFRVGFVAARVLDAHRAPIPGLNAADAALDDGPRGEHPLVAHGRAACQAAMWSASRKLPCPTTSFRAASLPGR